MSEDGKQNHAGNFWKNILKKRYFMIFFCVISALFILLVLGYAFMERILFPGAALAGLIGIPVGDHRDFLRIDIPVLRYVVLHL